MAAMAASRAGTVLAFNVAAVPVEGLQVRKKLERALHEWFQSARCPRFVLFGPGGTGKSTLAVKFAAAQAERGGGGLQLVFVLSASSMERDYTGLFGQCHRLPKSLSGLTAPGGLAFAPHTHTRARRRT